MRGRSKQLEFDWTPRSSSAPSLLGVKEVYERASQGLFDTLREDRRLERKPSGYRGEHLGEYFSMWANTPPEGGLILIGVNDNGTIAGCGKLAQTQSNAIEKTGMNYCPDAIYDLKRVPVINADGENDFIYVFWVRYRSDRVVETCKHDAFIRYGDSKKKLSPEEKLQLATEKRQIPHEEMPCNLEYPGDFDPIAISEYVANVRAALNWDHPQSNEDVLSLRRLGNSSHGRFVPNIACALLFAKQPNVVVPGSMIRIMRYDGTTEQTGERYNVVKDIPIEGTIPKIIARCDTEMGRLIREFTKLNEKDGKFYPEPEYPKSAW